MCMLASWCCPKEPAFCFYVGEQAFPGPCFALQLHASEPCISPALEPNVPEYRSRKDFTMLGDLLIFHGNSADDRVIWCLQEEVDELDALLSR